MPKGRIPAADSLFIVKNNKNDAVAIDVDSGGMPYVPGVLARAKFFTTRELAQSYARSFKDYTVHELTYEISDPL